MPSPEIGEICVKPTNVEDVCVFGTACQVLKAWETAVWNCAAVTPSTSLLVTKYRIGNCFHSRLTVRLPACVPSFK